MARVDEDVLPESETVLVFIACNVREARRAEDVLTQNGVDYCLSFEPFIRPSILALLTEASEHVGVGFSVRSGQVTFCRHVLSRNGLSIGIVDDP
jgi:hypothetical protein